MDERLESHEQAQVKRRMLQVQGALEWLAIAAALTGRFQAGCALFIAAMMVGKAVGLLRESKGEA